MNLNDYKTHDYEGLVAETIKMKSSNGDEINAYLAKPLVEGNFPTVVLIHHLPGWDELYKEFTRKFAHHGYIAICPDLYHREGNGSPDDVAAEVRSMGGVSDKQVIEDILGASNYAKNLPSNNGKIGLFGTCSGGRHAFLIGCSTDNFDAIVECWGGNVVMNIESLTDKQPTSPSALTSSLSSPLLGLFGNDDVSPTPEDVNEHEKLLKDNSKDYTFHRYDGAGHGFMYYQTPLYRQQQSMDAWEKIFDFYEDKLRS
ncbi:MAG: carboxymethylenebutenolidase [Chloroflexi bacterium]|jgi:carboxymethylenebutenolidase|nr:carboxymethylenebutenolidase [Chloroflexota bacterium]|tara:strand:+ start:6065 stop:6835 length:771 start_codon:yes stop_codon:yes gene_type:complete